MKSYVKPIAIAAKTQASQASQPKLCQSEPRAPPAPPPPSALPTDGGGAADKVDPCAPVAACKGNGWAGYIISKCHDGDTQQNEYKSFLFLAYEILVSPSCSQAANRDLGLTQWRTPASFNQQ